MTWSDRVVRAEVNGHPSLMYADRPSSVGSVVVDSARWSEREYLVHGQARVTFAEHARSVIGGSRRLRAAGIGPGDRAGRFAATARIGSPHSPSSSSAPSQCRSTAGGWRERCAKDCCW